VAELTFNEQEQTQIPNAVVISMAGAIDASTVVNFQSRLENLQLKGTKRFILDMEGIKYVNSTGLGSLVRLADQLESDGGGFALVKIHPKVKVVFDMLGLNAFFKIFPNQEAAIDHFRDGAEGEAPAGGGDAGAGAAPPPPPGAPAQRQQQQQQQQAPAGGGMPPQAVMPPQQAFQPRAIACAGCGVTLRIQQPGTFKCSRCGTIFSVAQGGQVEFTQVAQKRRQPLQMNLTCHDDCRRGLIAFLSVLAQQHGFQPDRLQVLQSVISELVGHITQIGYNNNVSSQYSVLVAPLQNEINVKLADHGRLLNPQDPNLFQFTRRNVQLFDHKPHPQGGNILTIKVQAVPQQRGY
jgi:stage II sporulation protein AA (anti-sigma F factor antagonist)